MLRIDGRAVDCLRPLRILPGFLHFADGSALVELGLTRVLCSVTVEERVPQFLKGTGKGWITAEYSLLPRSTPIRTPREQAGRGRSQEIQRFIGRCLRAVTDLEALGDRTLILDCDVLQADGGTRVAAVTGACVALYQAFHNLVRAGVLPGIPLRSLVAGVSVGLVRGEMLLDLCYEEDSRAEVDFNIVMNEKGELVEIQGTAEGKAFPKGLVLEVIALAEKGLEKIFAVQREAIDHLLSVKAGG